MPLPNKRIEMTDRGLHEALGTRRFYEGHEIDPVNLGSWLLALALVGLCWAGAWNWVFN